jgi:hypothetical protein
MFRIRQKFETNSIQDIRKTVQSGFRQFQPDRSISPGQTVAITAGSRGIRNIDIITHELINCLKQIGAKPFIVPAMGSHGGATAEGQLRVLAHYGITEDTMGVPIKSSMTVVGIGRTEQGLPVFIDRMASEADHIVVVNRIKAHTDFEAPIESGLMKMIAIGLGKQEAADRYHLDFMKHSYYDIITAVARVTLRQCPITFGVGIVENQKDETEIIQFMPPESIEETEMVLLRKAKQLFARIPFETIDLLIVDEISKTFSGTGMDQNVIARTCVPIHNVPSSPRIIRIFVRDLAAASGGNASGIGNADFTTQRLVDKIDKKVSYMNVITAVGSELIRIPIHYHSDREVIDAAARTIPDFTSEKARIVRIKNTLELEEMLISEAMRPEAEATPNLQICGDPQPVGFDSAGNMI